MRVCGLGRFVKQIHEIHSARFHQAHYLIDTRHQIVVGKQCRDTHYQAGYRGGKRGVNTPGKGADLCGVARICYGIESLNHTNHGAQEAKHRRTGGGSSQPGEPLREGCDLEVAGVFNSHKHIVHRTADTADTLCDEASHRGAVAAAEIQGAFNLALVDIVADAFHKSIVHSRSATNHYDAFNKYIKENESLLALAELLYNEGNVDLAHNYMRTALEDANYYNSRFKNSIIANVYPIVERSYLDILKAQRRKVWTVVWCMVGLSVILIIVALFSIKQTRAVSRSRSELERANQRLERSSEKLAEANIIREQYVGYFMNQYSKAIEKLDSFRLDVKRAIKVNKYEDVYVMASRPFKKELEDLYENFDNAFLNLFPNYIEEFNQLLKPEERLSLPKGKLNTTVRIYALIRLGITDLSQIADFLHFSVQTVYNYKSKIKKAICVSPEEFEDRVKRIGTMASSDNSNEEEQKNKD